MKLDGFGFDDNDLTEEQKALLAQRLQSQKNDWQEGLAKQRRLRLNESCEHGVVCVACVKKQFKQTINQDVSEEEACFIHDFCEKHQYDVSEKITDEGVFFLESMREMLEEKKKQVTIQADIKAKTDRNRSKAMRSLLHDDSESSAWEDGGRQPASSDDDFSSGGLLYQKKKKKKKKKI
ncbi:hypothetical protein RFI_36944 [Reticulomyxa filosa]|uniref:Uncharacterized protein n=1 Tax=Reticulomyxa filosa TaxID=46433 RepID=X6LG02_RETFI|nr:hypothetical protein RFI_36944 [Reticulomyxa filosa]|eukprot:ETO00494.1 hypothetical protein RFI_36944 [Reticulomyxa filosa]